MRYTLENKEGRAYLGESLLLVMYAAGDCDTVRAQPANDKECDQLLRALYDEFQCSEVLKDGDEIATADGQLFARCVDVHVVRAGGDAAGNCL